MTNAWCSAQNLIVVYGLRAEYYAIMTSVKLMREGDDAGAQAWFNVYLAIEELRLA